jgi:hypothetical protein
MISAVFDRDYAEEDATSGLEQAMSLIPDLLRCLLDHNDYGRTDILLGWGLGKAYGSLHEECDGGHPDVVALRNTDDFLTDLTSDEVTVGSQNHAWKYYVVGHKHEVRLSKYSS